MRNPEPEDYKFKTDIVSVTYKKYFAQKEEDINKGP
jgi:hypothetical protein